MNSSIAYPVQTLREHMTALEAALSVCLADPGHRPVHKLRTETRRVEALLLLLALVPGLPEHRKEASALLRTLAKLRRAAGEVRDLDVHRKMLEAFAEAEDQEANQRLTSDGTGPQKKAAVKKQAAKTKSAARSAKSKAASQNAALLSDAATDLHKHMGRLRDKAAIALQDLLKQRQAKAARAAEKLLKVLDPAKELALPASDLLRDAQSVLARDGLLKPETLAGLKKNDLHTIRKAAKAARYVAESLPEDRALADAAQSFESLQEAGGQWHDTLELASFARRYLGKSHELTAAYRDQRDQKLKAYRDILSAQVVAAAGRPRRSASSAKKPTSRKRTTA